MTEHREPCACWAESLSLAAAGCLEVEEEREVRRHLETCPACRKRWGELTQVCDALAEARWPADLAERAVVERLLATMAVEERPRLRSRFPIPIRDTWRWLMRSPLSRLATSAALLLALTAVALWFHSAGTRLAFADLVAPLLKAKTVQYKSVLEVKGLWAHTSTSKHMVLDAQRSRDEGEGPYRWIIITDWGQHKSLHLYPGSRQATVYEYDNSKNYENNPSTWLQLLQNARDNNEHLQPEPLGEKEIDGRRAVGFRIHYAGGGVAELWGDLETGLPVRVETVQGLGGSTKSIMSEFVFNAELDEALFNVEPPAGYTVKTEKADCTPLEEKDLVEALREYTRWTHEFPRSMGFDVQSDFWTKGNIQLMWEGAGLGEAKEQEELKRLLEKESLHYLEQSLDDSAAEESKQDRQHELTKKMNEILDKARRFQAGLVRMGLQGQSQTAPEARRGEFKKAQHAVSRGAQFADSLPPGADVHYVGQGVSPGAADTPIFWYRPRYAEKYRVVYADLSVVDADVPPQP